MAANGPYPQPSPDARRVLVVEDESLVRSLIVSTLCAAGFRTEGSADAQTALALLRNFDPDALVVDLTLGDQPGGIETISYADRLTPWVALVVLTNAAVPALAGVPPDLIPPRAAYLNKRALDDSRVLIETVENALAERPPRRDDRSHANPLRSLSPQQADLVRLVALGLSNSEIATRRGSTAHAVELALDRVVTKLGLDRSQERHTRVALARLYYANGPHLQ